MNCRNVITKLRLLLKLFNKINFLLHAYTFDDVLKFKILKFKTLISQARKEL